MKEKIKQAYRNARISGFLRQRSAWFFGKRFHVSFRFLAASDPNGFGLRLFYWTGGLGEIRYLSLVSVDLLLWPVDIQFGFHWK